MRFRLLGPLQVVHQGSGGSEVQLDLGPPKQRAVLAALLLARGPVVSVDRLIDAVWGDDVPGSATASLQAYVSNLRRALRDGAEPARVASPIVRQSPGYYFDVGPDDVDLAAFTSAVGRAGLAVEAALWDVALADSEGALSLWRGPFLDDLRDQPWVGAEATTAEELCRECLDYRINALLALGRVPSAMTAAAQLSAADPLSDRGCWLHVLALYRAGRTSEALDATARLHFVLGDVERARSGLSRARTIAERTGGAPTLARCALLTVEMAEPVERRALADAVAVEARRLGMLGVEAAARKLR